MTGTRSVVRVPRLWWMVFALWCFLAVAMIRLLVFWLPVLS